MTPEEGRDLTILTNALNSFTRKELIQLSEEYLWGTFGPNGDQPIQAKRLCDLDTDHLKNILITQTHTTMLYRKVILFLLEERNIIPVTVTPIESCPLLLPAK